ncbi:MAG: Nisin biosynthesis protein NisB [Peptostreptococcus russellii]
MYNYFNKFIIRTPRLPFSDIEKSEDILKCIKEWKIQEAIYIASNTLYSELDKLINNQGIEKKKRNRILLSAHRYITRMCTRSTPFGLFAGITLGDLNDRSSIIIDEKITRKTRLDMYLLSQIHELLIKDKYICRKINYKLNTSIWDYKNKIRYIETENSTYPKHTISEASLDKYLKTILKNGSSYQPFDYYSNIIECFGFTKEEADEYIYQLIDSQILIDELSLYTTGNDYLDYLIKKIEEVNYQDRFIIQLKEIQSIFDAIDNNTKASFERSKYDHIKSILKSNKIDLQNNSPFQVDYARKATVANLSYDIAEQVKQIIPLLNNISGNAESERLSSFRTKFINRYNTKKIPIKEALDSEYGIGYGHFSNDLNMLNPILDRITFPSKNNTSNTVSLTSIQNLLLNKLLNTLQDKKNVIELFESDFDKSELSENLELPNTIYALLNIVGKGKNIKIRLRNFCGSSAAIPIARFSHLDDNIKSFMETIVVKEKELLGNQIIAEVCHIPQSRMTNVLFRHNPRDYEIPYLTNCITDNKYVIDTDDLYIYHDNHSIRLYSNKLKKDVIPYLTCAHNYNNKLNLPVYQFLCDLQNQNKKNDLYFSWGYLENKLTHIPRVIYKNLVLSLEQWNIDTKSLSNIYDYNSDTILLDMINQWRISLDMPEEVVLSEYDNELYINFSNITSIKCFLELIKLKDKIILLEFFGDHKRSIVTDKINNSYLSECILFFYKSES